MKKWVIYLLVAIGLVVVIFDVLAMIKISSYAKKTKPEVQKELANEEILEKNNENLIETSYTSVKVSPNATLSFKTVYLGCGHNTVREEKAKENIVNKNEYEVSEILNEWEIKKFSADNVMLYKEVNKMCGNDYVIKENKGFIGVFKIDENGQEELYKETDVETKYLPELDWAQLKNGIKVNGVEEVNKILEDYE